MGSFFNVSFMFYCDVMPSTLSSPNFLFNIFAVPQRNTRVHFGNGIPFLLGLILTEKQGRSSIAGMVPVDGYSWARKISCGNGILG